MPKYLDESGLTRFYDNITDRPVHTFDTVAEMQAATYLKDGMTCHTNGFHASGDGGAAYYNVSASGTANGMDVLALQGGLRAIFAEGLATTAKLGIVGSNTGSIQETVDKYKSLVIDTDITITSEIVLGDGYSITIDDARVSATGCNAFHVLGSNCKITGKNDARIVGDGTNAGILSGGEGKTVSCNYNEFSNLRISNFVSGVWLYNYQQNSLTVYFNKILDCNISSCENGVLLEGYANAEVISNIIATTCGTSSAGGAVVLKSIDSQYPLNNNVFKIFHHSSANATTLRIEKCNYSVFDGIVCEQGGASAKSIIITDDSSTGNIFTLISNVGGFRTIPSACLSKNMFSDIGGSFYAGEIEAHGQASMYNGARMYGPQVASLGNVRYFQKTGIREYSDVTLLTFKTGTLRNPKVFKVKCMIAATTAVLGLKRYAEATIMVRTTGGSSSVDVLDSCGYEGLTVDSSDYTLHVRMPTNGTGTSTGVITFSIEEVVLPDANGNVFNHYTVDSGFTELLTVGDGYLS